MDKSIISKELCGEVIGIPCNAIQSISIGKSIVSVRKINGIVEEYNIYEVAHKCKEYLLDEGYYIVIHPFKVELFEKDSNEFMRDFHYPIKSKAIPYNINREIEACQWIYDNEK